VDGNTRIYRLPATPGSHEADMIRTLHVDGLITSADIDTASNKVVLTGYRNFYPFMVLITDFNRTIASDSSFRKIEFPQVPAIQTEGVAFIDSTRVMVSCEKSETDQQIFTFGLTDWEEMKGHEMEQSMLENWEPITLGKKKKGEKYIAIDISALRYGVFNITLQKYNGKMMTFPSYTFDRHMGKGYVKLDVYPLPINKYNVIVATGKRKSEKEVFLDD
jgi:hypothetical protein